jgi:hypothetical protein
MKELKEGRTDLPAAVQLHEGDHLLLQNLHFLGVVEVTVEVVGGGGDGDRRRWW